MADKGIKQREDIIRVRARMRRAAAAADTN
jgi:hypothetical protein